MVEQSREIAPPHVRLPSGPVGRLLASVGNLSSSFNAIHSRYAQAHDLGLRGVWVLSAISEGHASPGAIARLMMLPASVVSGDLNRLLKSKMIVRARDGRDGRRLVYSLTDAGRDVLAGAHALYVELLADRLGDYPAGQLDTLLRLLYDISRLVRAHVDQNVDLGVDDRAD
jgi:DNA-binding MarR family transcriptional regulator